MSDSLIEILKNFFKTKPIEAAWVFGSYARNEESNDSDIDIMVRYKKNYRPGLFGISLLMEDLEKITGKKIDLVEEGYLYPRIAKEVENQKIQIYERIDS